HTIFAMPFALIGFFLSAMTLNPSWILHGTAQGNLPEHWVADNGLVIKFFLVLLCMITARSAAMAFNRYLDTHFDALNPRTAIREIPAGIISREAALRFVIINCLLFILASFFINRICFYLSPVALFV